MTYQNLEFCFMLISTAVMKRGSMKIEEPHAERTRSQAARSTLSIESTTWQVLAIWRLRGRAGSETSLTQPHRRRCERDLRLSGDRRLSRRWVRSARIRLAMRG